MSGERSSAGVPPALEGVREIAIVDDALFPLKAACFDEFASTICELLASPDAQAELIERGISLSDPIQFTDEVLEGLSDPSRPLGVIHVGITECSIDLARLIEERHVVRSFVAAIRSSAACIVREIKPEGVPPDLRNCDIVFLDYYLEGTQNSRGGTLAETWAKSIWSAKPDGKPQLLVLMSSIAGARAFRKEFRERTDLDGGAFMFVGKADLDEPWKVRAHLKMLAGALPHSSAIGSYIAAISTEMEVAKAAFVEFLKRLDIADFAYIQHLSLQADGHPLGDYLSWLFSSHLGSLVFETNLRQKQQAVDKVVFSGLLMTPAAPSTEIAELYHNAQFSRNVGPLGKHPRDVSDTWIPFLQLGDIFLDSGRTKAVVILSADCDLAFTPDNGGRAPDPSRSVILVEGIPVRISVAKKEVAGVYRTSFFGSGQIYQIDWNFPTYKTVPLDNVRQHLAKEKYDTTDRDRLRPLYALKLQQEFGAYLLRIGAPTVPPVMWAVRGDVWGVSREFCERMHECGSDDVVAVAHKGQHSVVILSSVATTLRSLMVELAYKVSAVSQGLNDESDPKARRRTQLGGAAKNLQDCANDDDFWEQVISSSHALPQAGKTRAMNQLVFVRDVEDDKIISDNPAFFFRIRD